MSINDRELFQTSHLTILISYTIFATILVVESLLLGWEKWALILIVGGIIAAWALHIRHNTPSNVRLWLYAVLMMGCYFFYGIHQTSTFDLALVMAAIIMLHTMTGRKTFITLCQFTFYITMAYEVVLMILSDEVFDILVISRLILHFVMIFFIGKFAKSIIDKWMQVLNKSKDEVVQLTEATEHLNDFLANVSHELRTPVNAIIGLTTLCIDKSKHREVEGDLIAVRDAGRKVAEQISDILDYSEIDRKKAVCNNEDYMLSSVLHDLVTDIKQYKSKNVELIIDVDPSIPAVMNSDVSKIKKILKALITNGLKYTQKGGVYVRITTVSHAYGVNLCIEVTDTGKGMTEYELEKVYDSFYQADSSRSRQGGGLGLGLAIASGFVSLLGGFMTIDSKPDVGTTVNVSIPQRVVDPLSCMSVAAPDKLCLGAFLHFEKYDHPAVRDYYNSMVLNIVKGLGIQMHRVNNAENLKLLHSSVHLTHLFIAEEEYNDNVDLIEDLAKEMVVAVVANEGIVLPKNTRVKVLEKPFYCFPVVSILNSAVDSKEERIKVLRCEGVRALVVDDESMNLVVAKSIFGRYGMKVTTVTSGQEAIDICREKVFDIIFMDHMMSGMDGVEAMKRIRTDVSGLNGSVPVIALTANAMSSAKQMFLNEGFDGFVSKPVEIDELERVLKQVLPKSAMSFVDADGQTEELPEEPEEEIKPENRNEKDFMTELRKSGIDTDAGLKYCVGDKEFYKSLLVQYATESAEKIGMMKKYYQVRDWHNYEILVHALKSTSKMIGITDLSEKARALEKAAKENEETYILQNHEAMIRDYGKIAGDIKNQLIYEEEEDPDDDVFEFEPENDGGDKV
ncbi:signal transduction histidine kinase [Ruminococcaceae bacterium R-25]|nr:signal transduction histidine kinase [Ruminococcaceae bacterium R-25]SUQ22260.1 Signal transduction histidine kinase [Oscillospiraceae bacterium]